MEFTPTLVHGTLLKRYKRFLADVKLADSGKIITVHVPNSGSMKGVSNPESPCLLSVSPNPARKLSHTLEVVKTSEGSWVGVNTSNTNKLVGEAFHQRLIPAWKKFQTIQSEVKINDKTRLDFLLTSPTKKRYVEVKNVSMGAPPLALFPDAVTERGQKHLLELLELNKKGFETEILFVVQREDCKEFQPCDEIDPTYGKILREVVNRGVLASCWVCIVKPGEIKISHSIPIRL